MEARGTDESKAGHSAILLDKISPSTELPTRLHLREHVDGRTDLPGSAVTALEAIALDEGGLHGVNGARRVPAKLDLVRPVKPRLAGQVYGEG